jgi:hypothetical protein
MASASANNASRVQVRAATSLAQGDVDRLRTAGNVSLSRAGQWVFQITLWREGDAYFYAKTPRSVKGPPPAALACIALWTEGSICQGMHEARL